MKPWNLQQCFTTGRPINLNSKTTFWSFTKEKCKHKEQEQLLKTITSSEVSSFLVANHIAKAKKPFNISEELILPADKDTCCDILWPAIQQVSHVSLLTTTITRSIDKITEDVTAQL